VVSRQLADLDHQLSGLDGAARELGELESRLKDPGAVQARPAVALQLARFLVAPENALALAQSAQSVQPAVIGADTMAFYREHPEQQVMIRQFETAVPTPNHPAWVDLEAAIEDEVEEALHNRKTAEQAIQDAQRRLTELLSKPSR